MERITAQQMPEVKNENLIHLQRYVKFINSRPERKLKQKGYSTHHIYPQSIAIKNKIEDYDGDWNLIELTHREHFIAHMILFYCGYREMMFAFRRMNNYHGSVITGKIYEKLRNEFSDHMKNSIKMINTQTNTTHMIRKDKIDYYLSNNYIIGSTEKTNIGKVIINNGFECKAVNSSTLDKFINSGWKKGRLLTEKAREGIASSSKERAIGTVIVTDCLGNSIKINKNDIDEYKKEGYIVGYGVQKKHITKNSENKVVEAKDLDIWLNDGWELGMFLTNDIKTNASERFKNIIKDSICMYNKLLDKEIRIKKENINFYESLGYTLGRRMTPCKNRVWIYKDANTKMVYEDSIKQYLDSGWLKGRKK